MSSETKDQCAKENGNLKGPCVYILTNRSLGCIKIGRIETTTKNTAKRAEELFSTGVPTPFEVAYEHSYEDPKRLEKLIHEYLERYRVHPRREFFRFPVDKAIELIKELSNPPIDLFNSVKLLNMRVLGTKEDLEGLEDLEDFC